jgi:hypothetical protein
MQYLSLDCLQLCLALLAVPVHLDVFMSVYGAARRLHRVHGGPLAHAGLGLCILSVHGRPLPGHAGQEALNGQVLGHQQLFCVPPCDAIVGQPSAVLQGMSLERNIWNIVLALQMLF